MKGAVGLPIGGSSTDRREGWLQQRGPLIRPRESYADTTSEEEGMNKGERLKGQRMKSDMDSDEEKRRRRQIRFGGRIGFTQEAYQ